MMNRKASTDIITLVFVMVVCISTLIGGGSSQDASGSTGSNSTGADTLPAVNSTEPIVNSSIALTEDEDNLSRNILVVNSRSGEPCLLAALNATIQVSYKVLEGIVHESYLSTEEIQLPEDVTAQGVCGANKSHLLLEWGNGTFHLNLTFSLKEPTSANENSSWSMTAISASYDLSNDQVFPSSSDASLMRFEKSDVSLFTTELGHAYTCERDVTVRIGSEYDHGVTVKFHNIKLAAFGVTSSEFPAETDFCAEVDTDDSENVMIPLIVACCLSAIVIIIVIGYVIHRTIQRRREQSEYRAM